MLIRLFAILFVCYYSQASAQSLSNFRAFKLIPTSDTITLDSVSILESSFEIRLQDGSSLASALYVLNPYTTDVIIAKGLIGQELYLVINFNYYEEVSAIILLIIFTVISIDLLSGYLRKNVIEADSDR